MRLVRRAALSLFVGVLSLSAWAQDSASNNGWSFGVFTQGGTGVADRSDVKEFSPVGFRFGHTLAGRLEWNAEVLPYQKYLSIDGRDVRGFAANPLVLRWNFVKARPHGVAPFFLINGGLVKTSGDLPPGNTSDVNFTTGGGFGFNYFVRERRAVTFDIRAVHLSNASLGSHNPGINASVLFSIGYTWYR